MAYERLTEHKKLCGIDYIKLKDCDSYDCDSCIRPCEDAKERLAELEDKIESGLLVELPCKVGDKVYCPVKSANRVAYGTLEWIDISTKNIVYTVVERSYEGIAHKRPIQYRVGYVFTTKEAAEAKLEELRRE